MSTRRPALQVLLVEDHPALAAATADFLLVQGLEVQTALSGREALEIAPSFRPQLVLCDLNLPDMTGLEVIRELRSNPSTERTYAVILTAMPETQLPHRIDAGYMRVDAVMTKPITRESIRTLMEKLTPPTVAGTPSLEKKD